MKSNLKIFTAIAIMMAVVFSGCVNTSDKKEEKSTESHESSEKGEHERNTGEGEHK